LDQELDGLQLDILGAMMLNFERRMQRRAIRDSVFPKYEKVYSKDTFDVILSRKLNSLYDMGLLKRDNVGHQRVFYYIPKGRIEEVVKYLEKQEAYQLFDKYWDMLTPEQQKELTRSLHKSLQRLLSTMERFTLIFEQSRGKMSEHIVELLEHLDEFTQRQYSEEERREFLEQLHQLLKKYQARIKG